MSIYIYIHVIFLCDDGNTDRNHQPSWRFLKCGHPWLLFILFQDFTWNKPSSYCGSPMVMESSPTDCWEPNSIPAGKSDASWRFKTSRIRTRLGWKPSLNPKRRGNHRDISVVRDVWTSRFSIFASIIYQQVFITVITWRWVRFTSDSPLRSSVAHVLSHRMHRVVSGTTSQKNQILLTCHLVCWLAQFYWLNMQPPVTVQLYSVNKLTEKHGTPVVSPKRTRHYTDMPSCSPLARWGLLDFMSDARLLALVLLPRPSSFLLPRPSSFLLPRHLVLPCPSSSFLLLAGSHRPALDCSEPRRISSASS